MNGLRWYYAKLNKSERERQTTPYDRTLMWNLKNKTKQTKTETDSDAESRVGVKTFSYKISKQREVGLRYTIRNMVNNTVKNTGQMATGLMVIIS